MKMGEELVINLSQEYRPKCNAPGKSKAKDEEKIFGV
jgi:hypothetical protein